MSLINALTLPALIFESNIHFCLCRKKRDVNPSWLYSFKNVKEKYIVLAVKKKVNIRKSSDQLYMGDTHWKRNVMFVWELITNYKGIKLWSCMPHRQKKICKENFDYTCGGSLYICNGTHPYNLFQH